MRARRARQKAEREAVLIDCALPRDALKNASAAELATVKEKIAAIAGRGDHKDGRSIERCKPRSV